jgi:hypothetical protein
LIEKFSRADEAGGGYGAARRREAAALGAQRDIHLCHGAADFLVWICGPIQHVQLA